MNVLASARAIHPALRRYKAPYLPTYLPSPTRLSSTPDGRRRRVYFYIPHDVCICICICIRASRPTHLMPHTW